MKRNELCVITMFLLVLLCGCSPKVDTLTQTTENQAILTNSTSVDETEIETVEERVELSEPKEIIIKGEDINAIDEKLEEWGYPELKLSEYSRLSNPVVTKMGDRILISYTGYHEACEVRAEPTDGIQNISGVEVPDGVKNIGRNWQNIEVEIYEWTSESGMHELVMNYDPDKGVSYSFYCNNTSSGKVPYVIVNCYTKEPIVIREIDYSKVVTDIAVWEIFGEIKRYEYRVGMTVGQWVDSQYNTDGWYRLNNMVVNKEKTVYAWPDDYVDSYTQLIKY